MSGPTREEVQAACDGVHIEHCCAKHGCKYGDADCPVWDGRAKQAYPCEACRWDRDERARHVREAVEGLSDQKVNALAIDVYQAPTTGHARAALLAALTGEGE